MYRSLCTILFSFHKEPNLHILSLTYFKEFQPNANIHTSQQITVGNALAKALITDNYN